MVSQGRKLSELGFFLEVWGIFFSVIVQLLLFLCSTQSVGNARKLFKKLSEFLIDAMLF